MRRIWVVILLLISAATLSACAVEDAEPLTELLPGQVGDFLRTSGPGVDPDTGVDQAVYDGPAGSVLLRVRRVGADQIPAALGELPPTAANVGYDAALGQREGVFFTFADEYHAAWGNGDWVFVLSANSEVARITFLSVYGY